MIGDALPVATVNMPAYVSNIKEVMVETTPHKRFTMADIGRLEDRLKTVEYYTRLSLLELDTASMQVTDANGFDRFKSGFFVDNFKSHDSHQIAHPDFSVSIDKEEGHKFGNQDILSFIIRIRKIPPSSGFFVCGMMGRF